MQEWLISLLTANGIAIISAIGAALWWFIYRSFSHDMQIKNLGTKIDHLEEKLDQKIDMMIASNITLVKSHDERITRLEKYFDVIMQTQIKKSSEQLKMEF